MLVWLKCLSEVLDTSSTMAPDMFYYPPTNPTVPWTLSFPRPGPNVILIYIQLAIKSHRKYFWSQGLRSFASFNCHTNRNWILAAELKERPFHQVKNQPYLKPDPLSILYLLHLSHMHSEHFQQDFGQQVTLCSKGQHRIYPTIRKQITTGHTHTTNKLPFLQDALRLQTHTQMHRSHCGT